MLAGIRLHKDAQILLLFQDESALDYVLYLFDYVEINNVVAEQDLCAPLDEVGLGILGYGGSCGRRLLCRVAHCLLLKSLRLGSRRLGLAKEALSFKLSFLSLSPLLLGTELFLLCQTALLLYGALLRLYTALLLYGDPRRLGNELALLKLALILAGDLVLETSFG